MPGSGAAGLRAEPNLKRQALIRCDRGTGREAGKTEARAGGGDATDGDGDVAGVLEGDALRGSGLEFLIAKTDRGWCHLQGGKCLFRDPCQRDRGGATGGITGDLDRRCGISSNARLKRQRVIRFLSRQDRARKRRACKGELGTFERHRIESERGGTAVGNVQSL